MRWTSLALGKLANLSVVVGCPKQILPSKDLAVFTMDKFILIMEFTLIKTMSFVSEKSAIKLKKVNHGDVIIAKTSENVEDVCKSVAYLGKDDIVTGGHTAIFKHKQNPKYISYYINGAKDFQVQKQKVVTGVKVIDVSLKSLARIKIPIPPLSEQKRIVDILDKFDALVNDISTGLPAELNARRKQYEHYRDQLLTFKPLENQDAN